MITNKSDEIRENKTNVEAVKDYQKQLDDIKVRVPKGYREIIKKIC